MASVSNVVNLGQFMKPTPNAIEAERGTAHHWCVDRRIRTLGCNPAFAGPPPGSVSLAAGGPIRVTGRARCRQHLSRLKLRQLRAAGGAPLARTWCSKRTVDSGGFPKRPFFLTYLEREKGFEPSTSTLARLHSTAELLPQEGGFINKPGEGVKAAPQTGSAGPRTRAGCPDPAEERPGA
jgi:hypothetical protein